METDVLRQATDDELTELIGQLRALEAVTRRKLLAAVAEYDRREAWKHDGTTSMSAWLSMYGYARGHAAEMVRVAHRFDELPALAAVMDDGSITWDQSREVTRFASPATDERLAEEAPGYSVAELARIARRSVGVTNEEAKKAHERRLFRSRWDHENTEFRFWGRVPGTDGATIETVLDRLAERAPRDPETGEQEPYDRRMADALTDVCQRSLAEEAATDPAAATILVHVDAALVPEFEEQGRCHPTRDDGHSAESRGFAEIVDGVQVAITTVERLLCDNRWQIAVHTSDGCCVGVGTTTRTIPRWIRRQLRRRDTGCMFPGCNRTRWVEAHHIVHWKDGGPTSLDNLVTLCTHHHTLIHEGGWSLKGDHNNLTFFRPNGSALIPYFDTS